MGVARRAEDCVRVGRVSRTARRSTLALLACLAGAAAAQAAPAAHTHTHARRSHVPGHGHVHHTRAARRRGRIVLPRMIGVGNVPGCLTGSAGGLGALRTYHASVLRVVISPGHGDQGQARACMQAARAAGYRVHVAISYSNTWSLGRDVAYFRRQLGYYARYAWAISIGNEQELVQGGRTESGRRYATVWRAVEPLVARLARHALRVAGEVSPWGISFLHAAYAAGLPGAQVIAVHAYETRFGFDFPSVVGWARKKRLPLWVTEGMNGPNAWPQGIAGLHAVPLSRLAGATLADVWLD